MLKPRALSVLCTTATSLVLGEKAAWNCSGVRN
jgi:hypothetical protein